MLHPKKILIAPLDWGLGHATRCVPIIREFLNRRCEVQIASSGAALALLRQEFPNLKFHQLVAYRAAYSDRVTFMVKMLFQMPKFWWVIQREHRQIKHIIRNENLDWVISDNRYGCWSSHIPSVLITHQINILMSPSWKWLERIINEGNHRQIKKFSHCWVPDVSGGITGRMTESGNPKIKFIGMISRFDRQDLPVKREILFLCSGPEPQRSSFEKKIWEEVRRTGCKNYFMVKGTPGATAPASETEVNHLPGPELNEVVASSQLIISRPGYSTIMDLCKLGKKAVFIPTPGQTEQEYLAEQLKINGIAFYQNQGEFDLALALAESKKYKGFEDYSFSSNLLVEAIDDLLAT